MAKPKKEDGYYFTSIEEDAIIKYNSLTPDNAEREKIFNETIYTAMYKLAECVFNKYQFPYIVNDVGINGGINIALSHLATIMDKYEKKRGKAFSFLTFCCRNHLIQLNDYNYRRQLRNWSMDEVHLDTNHDTPDMEIFTPTGLMCEDKIHKKIDLKEFLDLSIEYWESHRKDYCHKPDHHKMMDILIGMMKEPSIIDFSSQTPGSTGKKDMLIAFRELTGFKTQKVMSFLRKIIPLQRELLKEYSATGKVTGDGIAKCHWNWRTKEYNLE